MNFIRLAAAVAAIVSFFFLHAELEAQTSSTDARPADRTAIGQTLAAFTSAWNAHDAHAFALTFTPDADFTNVLGATAHGRTNIESFHAPVFATIFKASHLTGAIRSVRFLTAQLAAKPRNQSETGRQFLYVSATRVAAAATDSIIVGR
ncbi:MAG: SgcJ/EcaC family oxidoreductase [Candidatus Cybelea sp.]